MTDVRWIECPDCGLLQSLPPPRAGHVRHCRRCNASFGHGLNWGDAAPALALTALVLFLLSNFFPLMGIEFAGRAQEVHLVSGIGGLADYDLTPLALLVLVISILAPLGRVLALSFVLMQLRGGRPPSSYLPTLLRWAEILRPWAMLDVFLVGALVSLTKLHELVSIEIDVGFWTLGLLVLALAAFDMVTDRRALWDVVSPPPPLGETPTSPEWIGCRECGLVQREAPRCSRCLSALHRRKPDSLHRSAALVVTGLVLYLPANLYPVITFISFGRGTPATIMGGVLEMANGSDWPLALIVFAASVAVPLLKLLGLALLHYSVRRRSRRWLMDRTRLFRLIELVSRWSSVDIFVAALLTALVALGNLVSVEPGLGVLAFGAVVLTTMLATEFFDPRLIWDAAGANDV